MSKKSGVSIVLEPDMHATLEVIAERELHTLGEQILIFIQQGIDEYQKANKLRIVPDYDEGSMTVAFEAPTPPSVPF